MTTHEREECNGCGRTEAEGHARSCVDHSQNRATLSDPTTQPTAPATPRTGERDSMSIQQIARNIVDEFLGIASDRRHLLMQEIAGALGHEREAAAPAAEALRAALWQVDDAIQYAIAYMNDPEGLANTREEWRDRLRDALQVVRALAASPSTPDTDPTA